ncbi:hypothetical protein BJX76DRAFT_354267 [Aspergillus varians]
MHFFATLASAGVCLAGASAAPGPVADSGISINAPHTAPIYYGGNPLAIRDDEMKDSFYGKCESHSECGVGSFCVAHWCTVARKLEDGGMNLAARDVVAEDVSFHYWYLEARATEQKKPKNKCPKKCGGGKHCCAHQFCQPPRCLGES